MSLSKPSIISVPDIPEPDLEDPIEEVPLDEEAELYGSDGCSFEYEVHAKLDALLARQQAMDERVQWCVNEIYKFAMMAQGMMAGPVGAMLGGRKRG